MLSIAAMTMACTNLARNAVVRDHLSNEATSGCRRVTIDELWTNPWPYEDQRVCLSGFLGRMVPYGEDSPDLFATKQAAADRHSVQYLKLGIRMSMPVQEKLASFSERMLDVVGIFEFDASCWPSQDGVESKFRCFPPRPMAIRHAELALSPSD
jgi:hypothetical protein